MFSFISLNWQGRPLESYEMVVNLIANTTTKKGLDIKAFLDKRKYEKGIKIPDKEYKKLNVKFHKVNANWNYTISPK